ncbi:MAG: MauE/DoxX family redox-associated membrane protein [Thermoguttaceae bacterium]
MARTHQFIAAVNAARRGVLQAARACRIRGGYDVVRIASALLLLVAATLKAYQLATEPVLGTGILESRWFLMATVQFELLLGVWLLSGLLPRLTWLAALACFSAFACVSLYKALSGYTTCGCFGKVEVSPWHTAILDVFVVLSLLCFRPNAPKPLCNIGSKQLAGRVFGVSLISLCVGVLAWYAMTAPGIATIFEDGIILGDGDLVILDPQNWAGKRFPLLRYIDDCSTSGSVSAPPLRERLAEGEWFVVLYREGCPRCREILDSYRRNVGDPNWGVKGNIHFAFVQVPPVGQVPTAHSCEVGALKGSYRWFLTTPIGVHIRNGVVEAGTANDSDQHVESSLAQLRYETAR